MVDLNELAQDAGADQGPGTEVLGRLGELADQLDTVNKEIKQAEEHMKMLKERELDLSTRKIPELMDEYGLTKIVTRNGFEVTIADFVQASIRVEDRHAAYQWLESNGAGDLIKTSVSTDFDRGSLDKARELQKKLMEEGLSANINESVHHSTLKAYVREQVEKGQSFPDIFNVYVGRKAKIAR